jgi:hypothetical protein
MLVNGKAYYYMDSEPMVCTNDYAFGGISGSTFAFCFFLVISLVIGVGTYTLLVHPKIRNVLFHEWSPPHCSPRFARVFRVSGLGGLPRCLFHKRGRLLPDTAA